MKNIFTNARYFVIAFFVALVSVAIGFIPTFFPRIGAGSMTMFSKIFIGIGGVAAFYILVMVIVSVLREILKKR